MCLYDFIDVSYYVIFYCMFCMSCMYYQSLWVKEDLTGWVRIFRNFRIQPLSIFNCPLHFHKFVFFAIGSRGNYETPTADVESLSSRRWMDSVSHRWKRCIAVRSLERRNCKRITAEFGTRSTRSQQRRRDLRRKVSWTYLASWDCQAFSKSIIWLLNFQTFGKLIHYRSTS